jgi:hypothetical protein
MTATVIAMQSDNTDLRGVGERDCESTPGRGSQIVAVALPGGSWN